MKKITIIVAISASILFCSAGNILSAQEDASLQNQSVVVYFAKEILTKDMSKILVQWQQFKIAELENTMSKQAVKLEEKDEAMDRFRKLLELLQDSMKLSLSHRKSTQGTTQLRIQKARTSTIKNLRETLKTLEEKNKELQEKLDAKEYYANDTDSFSSHSDEVQTPSKIITNFSTTEVSRRLSTVKDKSDKPRWR